MNQINIIITGGASGIGLASAKKIAGMWPDTRKHIAIFDINSIAGESVAQELRATENAKISTSFHRCDVTSWESQAAAFAAVIARVGRVDVVCANAGVAEKGALISSIDCDTPTKPNMFSCEVNFYGVIYSVSLSLYYMTKNKISPVTKSRGSIICTASNSGLYPFPLEPMYAAAKHGVVGLVRSLGGRLRESGIRINGLAPCVVETNIAPGVGQLPGIDLTSLDAVTNAVETLLTDSEKLGQIAEISEDHITFSAPQAFVDESTAKNYAILNSLCENPDYTS